jgi:hypothetical protein
MFLGQAVPIDHGCGTGGHDRISVVAWLVFSVRGDALLGISAGSQRLLAFLAVRDRMLTRLQVG